MDLSDKGFFLFRRLWQTSNLVYPLKKSGLPIKKNGYTLQTKWIDPFFSKVRQMEIAGCSANFLRLDDSIS